MKKFAGVILFLISFLCLSWGLFSLVKFIELLLHINSLTDYGRGELFGSFLAIIIFVPFGLSAFKAGKKRFKPEEQIEKEQIEESQKVC